MAAHTTAQRSFGSVGFSGEDGKGAGAKYDTGPNYNTGPQGAATRDGAELHDRIAGRGGARRRQRGDGD